MKHTLNQAAILLILLSLHSLHGMEQPNNHEQPTFQCKVPFGNDEFPDEIPVEQNAYHTTLLYNENDTSYYYEPDPERPGTLKRKKYDATFDLIYHNEPPPPPSPRQTRAPLPYLSDRQSRLNSSSHSFAQRSEYYARRDFEIDQYLHAYNQFDEHGQAMLAHENKKLHELAMRRIAYENQPPFRQRVKTSLNIIGEKISSTKDRFSSWLRGPATDDNPEKELDERVTTRNDYQRATAEQTQQSTSHHRDYINACLEQQSPRKSQDPFHIETVLEKFEKKAAERAQEDAQKEEKLEEKREAVFAPTGITFIPGTSSSSTSESATSTATDNAESTKKPSLFPAEKPKEQDKDKKPHGIPQEIKEKYEEYKKQESTLHDKTEKSAQTQRSESSNITAITKEPMIDVINQDSKAFIAKLDLPRQASGGNSSSSTRSSPPPPAATSLPTSPLSQINSYQAYASTAPTRTSSAQSSSLQSQRQYYNNQISQAARRESSTARAWGGSQERKQLEAQRSKVESAIRYQEALENYSRGTEYGEYLKRVRKMREAGLNHARYMQSTNDNSAQYKRKIRYLLKNGLISEKEKKFINDAWSEETKKSERPDLVCLSPLNANTVHSSDSIYETVLRGCNEKVNPLYERQSKWEKEILLPILRENNFDQANKLVSKKIDREEWLKIRRKLEKHHSDISKSTIARKKQDEITKKTDEEYKKIGYTEWFFSWDKYGKIRAIKKEEAYNEYLDEISHKKNLEHQQKLAAEKLERERQQAEIERQLAAERAEQERIQKVVELAQKKEANAKLVGEKLEYEAKKIRLQQEFELEQSKKRLEAITRRINAPHYQREKEDFSPATPQPTFDQIELIVEPAPSFSLQDILAQPAHDFLSTGRHETQRTDPEVITELIADPTTPHNIVELLERAQFLQNNVDDKALNDLSSTATELILYGEIISKKMAESRFARSTEESERLDALKIEIVRISSFILDCIGIAHEEMKKKRAEHYELFKFVSEHPIESLKIVTPILAHITQKIVRLAVVLAPYDDAGPDLFIQNLTDGTISDLQKESLDELTALVDASSKSVTDFLWHTSRREQFKGGINFGFDLAAQHLILKSCAMLKSTLRTNFIQANVLQSVATTAEELATLEATAELALQQKQLVLAIEHAVEGDLAQTAENVGRTQRVNKILDAATEFSQSEKAKEILSRLEGGVKNTPLPQRHAPIRIPETELPQIKVHLERTVAHLETLYDKSIIDEAKSILKFDNDRVLIKMHEPEKLLESTIEAIQKIDSNPRWKDFRFDPAKNGGCNITSIEEAIAGIAAEEQEFLQNLVREATGKGEFIDPAGKIWDVKTAKSYALNGEHIFNTQGKKEFLASLEKSLTKDLNENLIVNISYLIKTEHGALYDLLRNLPKSKLERIIIIDAINPMNSKTTFELLKYLGV